MAEVLFQASVALTIGVVGAGVGNIAIRVPMDGARASGLADGASRVGCAVALTSTTPRAEIEHREFRGDL